MALQGRVANPTATAPTCRAPLAGCLAVLAALRDQGTPLLPPAALRGLAYIHTQKTNHPPLREITREDEPFPGEFPWGLPGHRRRETIAEEPPQRPPGLAGIRPTDGTGERVDRRGSNTPARATGSAPSGLPRVGGKTPRGNGEENLVSRGEVSPGHLNSRHGLEAPGMLRCHSATPSRHHCHPGRESLRLTNSCYVTQIATGAARSDPQAHQTDGLGGLWWRQSLPRYQWPCAWHAIAVADLH